MIKSGTSPYTSLHRWVRQNKGRATICENCGSTKSCQWANISGFYLKDLSDYKALCASCHGKFDTGKKGGWKRTPEANLKTSIACKGRVPWNKGRPWTQEERVNLRGKKRSIVGENNPNWRGGTSAKYRKVTQ